MCFQEKPLTEYYNSSYQRDGKQNNCIPCYKQYYKKWVENRNESAQTAFPQSKVCLDCRVERPISQFGKRKTSKDKKMSYCKDCWLIRTRNALAKHYQKKVRANGGS